MGGKEYGENFDRIFGKKPAPHISSESGACLICGQTADDSACPGEPVPPREKEESKAVTPLPDSFWQP